jgi:hypothetical protein
MMHGIRLSAILMASSPAFLVGTIVETEIVHLVPLVQAAECLERADLSSARSRMQEIGLYPENFHR